MRDGYVQTLQLVYSNSLEGLKLHLRQIAGVDILKCQSPARIWLPLSTTLGDKQEDTILKPKTTQTQKVSLGATLCIPTLPGQKNGSKLRTDVTKGLVWAGKKTTSSIAYMYAPCTFSTCNYLANPPKENVCSWTVWFELALQKGIDIE